MCALAVKRPHVWAEEFVWRAGQEVTVQGLYVNQPVWSVMHGINEHERASGMSELRDFRDGVDRSHHVRGVSHGDELCFRRDFALQIIHIQSAIAFTNIDLADDDAFFFEGAPGSYVGIVVQHSHHNFIAWIEL